ncbi:carotenoid oxygenase family protein [Psychrosphaera sp. F3M07]|uniref:carotenoid oxygenase family protein n=1 Tax=Psychrosphaera sp. F3M07 TaxID=2841560 RepID=UPI001C08F782|nr:carotenoid oxygenase family protein [Psychrosphaera sp. F3M07]MBU2918148.1 carotenoid oxygenase family protein [Psychrosphaera sp. F3M07]
MQRRHFLKGCASLGAGAVIVNSPLKVFASTETARTPQVLNYKALFNDALSQSPELIGFTNVDDDFAPEVLSIEGKIPLDIQGTFYRNGPGKLERGEHRYQHLFEGDGMLQSFTIAQGKIVHKGKFINTPKFQKEQKNKKFLYSGPETVIPDALSVTNADVINTANTNVIAVGDDLWALWEAGSATKVDAKSLEYKEQVILGEHDKYKKTLQGLPFSAHPKVEANGDIWNFGLNSSGHVVLYHLAPNGRAKNVALVNAKYRGGMLHDFLMTEKHLLIILPSLSTKRSFANNRQGGFSRISFDKEQAQRVLVIDKASLTLKKEYELEAGFAFHYGNAWEETDGTIRFDASLYPNADSLHNLSNMMKGEINHSVPNAKAAFYTLSPNGKSSQMILDTNSEFPEVCDHRVGLKNEYLYHLSSKQNSFWSNTVCGFNVNSGKLDSYEFGEEFLVEEHITVCPKQKEGTGYLIGSALHVPSKRTCLNIFNVENISDGPIARAWLSHHLPLGFHGTFKAA